MAALAVSLGTVMIGAACSPEPAPVSRSLRDPSNPAAPEGTTPRLESAEGSSLPAGTSGGEGDHMHHHADMLDAGHGPPSMTTSSEAGAPGVVYVCPMHPEVTSNAAGRCPKCNMNLVPKK